MSYRFYHSPIIHCPSLCPYEPPKDLFLDDYAPEREDGARAFCTAHCWLAAESDRPCMVAFRRKQARAEALDRAAHPEPRPEAVRLRPARRVAV